MNWYIIEFPKIGPEVSEEFVLEFINLLYKTKLDTAVLYEIKPSYTQQFVICISDHKEVFLGLLKKYKAKECEIKNFADLSPVFNQKESFK